MQPLLTQRQCVEALALSERTLERFRVSGVDPKFVRMGKSIRYRLSDVDAWIASRVVGSTAEDINSDAMQGMWKGLPAREMVAGVLPAEVSQHVPQPRD